MEGAISLMRLSVILCLLILGLVSCKEKSVSEEKPAVEKQEQAATSSAVDKPTAESGKSLDRERLASVFSGMWCINKRRDRKGLSELLAKHQFGAASEWAAQWSQMSARDPKWAEETMVRVINEGCK